MNSSNGGCSRRNKLRELPRGSKTLSAGTYSSYGQSICGENACSRLPALPSAYTPPRRTTMNLSSPFSSHQTALAQTRETTAAFSDLYTSSLASVHNIPPPTLGRSSQCGLCLGPYVRCSLAREANRHYPIQIQDRFLQASREESQNWSL